MSLAFENLLDRAGGLFLLALGVLGAIVGACVVHHLWQQGRLHDTVPVPQSA